MPQIDAVLPQRRFISGFNQVIQIFNQLFLVRRKVAANLDQVGCAVCYDTGVNGQIFNEGFQLRQLFNFPFLFPVAALDFLIQF